MASIILKSSRALATDGNDNKAHAQAILRIIERTEFKSVKKAQYYIELADSNFFDVSEIMGIPAKLQACWKKVMKLRKKWNSEERQQGQERPAGDDGSIVMGSEGNGDNETNLVLGEADKERLGGKWNEFRPDSV